jgi:hypothetical protein
MAKSINTMEHRDASPGEIASPSELDLLSQVPSLKGRKVKVRKVEQKNDGSYTLRDTTLFVKPRDANSEPTPVDPGVVEVDPAENAEERNRRRNSDEKELAVNIFGVKPERANMTTPRSDQTNFENLTNVKNYQGLNEQDEVLKAFSKQRIEGPAPIGEHSLDQINHGDSYSNYLRQERHTMPHLQRSVSETNVFRLPPKVNSVLNAEGVLKQEYLEHVQGQKQIVGQQISALRAEINSYLDGLQQYFNSRFDAFYDNFSSNFELFKKKCHEYRTVDTPNKSEYSRSKHDIKIVSISFLDTKRKETITTETCDLKIDSANLEKTLQRRVLTYLAENIESRIAYPPTFGSTQLAKENWSQTVREVNKTLQERLGNAGPFFSVVRHININHIGLRWEGQEIERKNSDQENLQGQQDPSFMDADFANFESVVLDPESQLRSLNGERMNYGLVTPNAKQRESIIVERDTPSFEPNAQNNNADPINEAVQMDVNQSSFKKTRTTSLNELPQVNSETEEKLEVKESPDSGTKDSSDHTEAIKNEHVQQDSENAHETFNELQQSNDNSNEKIHQPSNSSTEPKVEHIEEPLNSHPTLGHQESIGSANQDSSEPIYETLDQAIMAFLNKQDHNVVYETHCRGENLGGQTIRGVSPCLDSYIAFGDEFYYVFDNQSRQIKLFNLTGLSISSVCFLPTSTEILGLFGIGPDVKCHYQFVLMGATQIEDSTPIIIVGIFEDFVLSVLKCLSIPSAKKIDSIIPLKDGQSFIAITDSNILTIYNVLSDEPVKVYDAFQKKGVSIISCCALICRDYAVSYTSDSYLSFFEIAYKESSEFLENLPTAYNISRVRIVNNSTAITSMQATDDMRLDCIDASGNFVDIALYKEADKLTTGFTIVPIENQSIDKFAVTRLEETPAEGHSGFMTFLSLKEGSIGIYDFATQKDTKTDCSDLLEGFTSSEQSFFMRPFRGLGVEIILCTPQAVRRIQII